MIVDFFVQGWAEIVERLLMEEKEKNICKKKRRLKFVEVNSDDLAIDLEERNSETIRKTDYMNNAGIKCINHSCRNKDDKRDRET
ncbi:hypothetical protein CEXT_419011 [Caerostris extrusa]|uniref:Uncharacterized protein n=1 Tax=Caerostris extrusa TaxID=172846 RepID=A0AAV4S1M9_CAEEX|nr:hypothetical protein CEXT_419011 [Caerostris extrusa]